MTKAKIIKGHTLDEYNKKYGYLRKIKKPIVFLVNKDEKQLKDRRTYWQIEDRYYQIPYFTKSIFFTLISILGVAVLTTAIVVPVVLINRKGGGSNYGGEHFQEIQSDVIEKTVTSEGDNDYTLKLKEDKKVTQAINASVIDKKSDHEDSYAFDVTNPEYDATSKGVKFKAGFKKKAQSNNSSNDDGFTVTGTFKIKVNCVENSNTIWSDLIGTFTVKLTVSPTPPIPPTPEDNITITFDGNGGGVIENNLNANPNKIDIEVKKGSKWSEIKDKASATKDGTTFLYWTENKDTHLKIDDNKTFDSDSTVYAYYPLVLQPVEKSGAFILENLDINANDEITFRVTLDINIVPTVTSFAVLNGPDTGLKLNSQFKITYDNVDHTDEWSIKSEALIDVNDYNNAPIAPEGGTMQIDVTCSFKDSGNNLKAEFLNRGK